MWKRRPSLVALLATLLAGSFVVAGAPGSVAQQTDKQRQLAHDIAETSKATQQAREAAVAFQAEKARLESTLGGLQTQLDASQASLAAAQAEIDRIGVVSTLLVAEIDDTQRKLDDASEDAKASAVLLYKRRNNSGVMELIGSTNGSGQFVEAKQYLEHVSKKRRNDLSRADRLRKALDGQKAELDEQHRLADEARAQAAAKAQEIESLFAQQQSARDGAARAQEGFEAQAAQLTAKQAEEEADLAAEDARVRALIAAASDDGSSGGGSLGGSGAFIRPVGGSISSGFGYRTDPVTGAQSTFHAGIDFGVGCGTPIKAAGNGTVIVAGDQGGYGNAVIINHGGGLVTLYGHQSAIAVGYGQVVTAGQVIGYVGSTGKSTGCHLHFEVRQNGNPVNPLGYL